MNRVAKLLVCAVTASGGCATSSIDDWTPSSGDGKADGFQLLKGSDIPSQFVDPHKSYVDHRFMYYLDQVGALTGPEKSAADKSDAIFPNRNRDEQLSVEELVKLEQTPGALTTAELAAMPALWSLLEMPDDTHSLASLELSVEDRSVPYSKAVLAVSEPGAHDTTLALGGITFTHKMSVGIREYRNWNPGFLPLWSAIMFLDSVSSVSVQTTGGDLLVRHVDHGGEVFHSSQPNWDLTGGGEYVLERFVGGQCVDRYRIVTPPDFGMPHQKWLTADFTLELADGTPLVRSLETVSTSDSDEITSATWTYNRTAQPQPQVDPAVLARMATPVSSLATGRYRVPLGGRDVTLELYANGVVKIEGQTTKTMLRDRTKALYWSDLSNHASIEFAPTTNQLRLQTGTSFDDPPDAVVTVTSAMRVP